MPVQNRLGMPEAVSGGLLAGVAGELMDHQLVAECQWRVGDVLSAMRWETSIHERRPGDLALCVQVYSRS